MRPSRSPFAAAVLALRRPAAPLLPTAAAVPIPKPPTVDARAYILDRLRSGRMLAAMKGTRGWNPRASPR